jgi:site-specific DNA recombinase
MATQRTQQHRQPLPESNGHAPLRAVLYARVSTEEQRERQSIETQIDFARSWCQRENISLIDIYRDEGISGTIPFEERPGGKRLLADARQKKFTAVLVYKVDRLGRADVVSHVALHHLETLGISLRALTEPFDTSTPQGRFMFSILVANSTMERNNIRERSIAGTDRVAKQGKWSTGRPPYGYSIDAEGRLAISETPIGEFSFSEADVVRMIFRWAVEERLPLLPIAVRLNDMGVPPASLTEGRQRKCRKGARKAYRLGIWRVGTIGTILHKTTYRGEHLFGGLSKKPDRERITQDVPAIVSPQLWQQAQDALRQNLQWAKRNAKREYLLSGLMRCGFCGKRLQATTCRGRSSIYRCGGSMGSDRALLGSACPNRRLPLSWIEALVWEELKSWILNYHDLKDIMTEALQEQERKRKEWTASLDKTTQDLSQIETQRSRIFTLYRKGHMSEADLEKQLNELKAETQHSQQVAEELEKRLRFTIDLDTAVSTIRYQIETFRNALRKETVPFPIKRKIVEAFVNEIIVSIKRGSALEVTLIETILFRPDAAPRPAETDQDGKHATLFQREGTPTPQKEFSKNTVKICYRFPLPLQQKSLVPITSSMG